MAEDHPAIVDQLRAALRSFPTGVTVVAADVDGTRCGLTISAFTSVSLEPPTVLFCVNSASKSHDVLLKADQVGISLLAGSQADIAMTFATAGADKFGAVDWAAGRTGSPLISGAAAHLEGTVVDRHSIGTHTVFIVKVADAVGHGRDPLVYFERRFVHGEILAESR